MTQHDVRTWSTRTLEAGAAAAVVLGVGAGAALGSLGDDAGSDRNGPGQMRGNLPGQGPPGGWQQVPGTPGGGTTPNSASDDTVDSTSI